MTRSRLAWRWVAALFPIGLTVVVALALSGCGERARPGAQTWVQSGQTLERVPPGARYRLPAGGRVIRIPENGSLRFPPGPDYRLFSREGIEIPIAFQVTWRLTGDEAVRRYAAVTGDSTFVDSEVAGALRRVTRTAAARFGAADIAADRGEGLRSALSEALQAATGLGFELTVASLDAAGLASAAQSAAPTQFSGRKILFIGIDAMDGRILDDLRAGGAMPNVDRLIRRGARADLQTLTPMLSPLLWTTMATGVGPDRHGILDFLVTDPATGRPIPVTSSMRRAPAFWNIATARNRSVDVIGWLASWPAESIRGRLVSDRFGFLAYAAGLESESPAVDAVSPSSLAGTLRSLIIRPDQVGWTDVREYVDVPRAEFEAARRPGFEKGNVTNNLILTLATAETWQRIGVEFLRQPADLTAVYFEFLDALGHLGMPYAAPRMSGISEADFRRYRGIVPAAYREMDRIVGRLVAAAGDSAIVVIASDHGFLSGAARPTGSAAIEGGQAARWHRSPATLIMAGPGIREGATIDRASVLDIAPTLLHLLGLPVSREMEGQVITGAFTPAELVARPVRTVARYELPAEVWAPPESPPARPAGALADDAAPAGASPESLKTWNNLGLVLEQRGDLAGAESLYRRVLSASPEEASAMNNLGNVLRRRGRMPEAISTLEQLTRLHPDYRPALQNLGACFLEANRPSDAIPWFDRALAAEPGNVTALTNRGHARFRLGQIAEAGSDFQEAIRIEPRAANAWFGVGLVAGTRGDLAAAQAAFEKTLAFDPGHATARQNIEKIKAARR